MSFIAELDSLICIFSSGKIVKVNTMEGISEILGEIEGGVYGASWGPVQERLALVFGKGKIMLLDNNMETILEKDLDDGDGTTNSYIDHDSVCISWRGDAKVSIDNLKPVLHSELQDRRRKEMPAI